MPPPADVDGESPPASPVVIELPLRGGGWVAVTSPADRIPSHGTDALGQRYAYDFIQVDHRPGGRWHPAGALRTMLLGVPTRECYAWGEPVHAPFAGEVVSAMDGIGERGRVHPMRELILALWTSLTFKPEQLARVVGNHVVMREGDRFAAFAHLAPGSVAVRAGEHLRVGDVLGRVGHTGNSTNPHLHLQLMDAADPRVASGLPCAFAAYEVERGGTWVRVERGIPGRAERIRSVA